MYIQCHHSKRYHSVPGSRGYHLLEGTTCCVDNDWPPFQYTYTISTKLRWNIHILINLTPDMTLYVFNWALDPGLQWFSCRLEPKNTVPAKTARSRQKPCQRQRWYRLLEGATYQRDRSAWWHCTLVLGNLFSFPTYTSFDSLVLVLDLQLLARFQFLH